MRGVHRDCREVILRGLEETQVAIAPLNPLNPNSWSGFMLERLDSEAAGLGSVKLGHHVVGCHTILAPSRIPISYSAYPKRDHTFEKLRCKAQLISISQCITSVPLHAPLLGQAPRRPSILPSSGPKL